MLSSSSFYFLVFCDDSQITPLPLSTLAGLTG
jgi:hypothetical protein